MMCRPIFVLVSKMTERDVIEKALREDKVLLAMVKVASHLHALSSDRERRRVLLYVSDKLDEETEERP